MKPHNIHDKFVRETFSDPDRARVFLEEFLPVNLAEIIDFTSLSVSKESYMTEELKEHFSDLIIEVGLKNSDNNSADIALLFEHKSYPDKNVLIQVGFYLFAHYFKCVQQKQPFKAVIPIIYYQGNQNWEVPQLSGLLHNYPEQIIRFLPNIEHLLIALKDIPNDRIAAILNAMLSVALYAQKLRFQPLQLQRDFERILKLFPLENIEWNYFEMTIVYILQASDLTEKDLAQSLKSLPPPIKDQIMTTYDRIHLKGIEQGIEQGIEKGKLEGKLEEKTEVILNCFCQGLQPAFIANIVSLSEEEVVKILVKHGLTAN